MSADVAYIYISRTMETRVEHEFVLKSLSLSRTESLFAYQKSLTREI